MPCRIEINSEWFHFDASAGDVANSIGEAMGECVQVPMAAGRGVVVFGKNYSVAVLDTQR